MTSSESSLSPRTWLLQLLQASTFRGFTAALLLLLLLPLPALAVHYLGHGVAPSQGQIAKFCADYPKLIKAPGIDVKKKNQYQSAYQQYCGKKPAPAESKQPAPTLEQARIDNIRAPSCLARGAEIRVQGRQLIEGSLECRLEANGQRRTLRPTSRNDKEFRFRLDQLLPGPNYVLHCSVDRDTDRLGVKGCIRPGISEQVVPGVEVPVAGIDLSPEIDAPALSPGQMLTIEVSVHNRGQSSPRGQRHRLVLALVDRDLSRGVGNLASALSPTSGNVLVQKQQWVLRIPARGQAERVPMVMNIPAQIPDSQSLYWCAFADSDRTITETNENNNLNCVPASDRQQTITRTDLKGVFGRQARRLQKNPTDDLSKDERLAALLTALPADIRPTVEKMNTLFINDSFLPGAIGPPDTALVEWNVGETYEPAVRPDGMWLLISDGPLDDSDCATDVAARFGDHVDAGLEPLFSVGKTLQLESGAYTLGNTYRVIGCLWKDGAYTGDWTNVVAFDYASPASTTLAGIADATGTNSLAGANPHLDLPVDLVAASIWPDGSREQQVFVLWREKSRRPLNTGRFTYAASFVGSTGGRESVIRGVVDVTQDTRASAFGIDIPISLREFNFVVVEVEINIDRHDYPNEPTFDNNRIRRAVRVRRADGSIASARPDLSVDILSVRKLNLTAGPPLAQFVVRNTGRAEAGESTLLFRGITEGGGIEDGLCRWIETRVAVPPLARDESFQSQNGLGQCDYGSPSPGGLIDVDVTAQADLGATVAESDETNNTDTHRVPRLRGGLGPEPPPVAITVGGITRFEVIEDGDGDRRGRGELRRILVSLMTSPASSSSSPAWAASYDELRVEGEGVGLRAGDLPRYLPIAPGDIVSLRDPERTLTLYTPAGESVILVVEARESDCVERRVGLCDRHDTSHVTLHLMPPDNTVWESGGCAQPANRIALRPGFPQPSGPTLQPLDGWFCVQPLP